jgi:hypothetical protein
MNSPQTPELTLPREITHLAEQYRDGFAERFSTLAPDMGESLDGDSDTTIPDEHHDDSIKAFGMIKIKEDAVSQVAFEDTTTGANIEIGMPYVRIALRKLPREERTRGKAGRSLQETADYLRSQEYEDDTLIGAPTYGRLALAAARTFGFDVVKLDTKELEGDGQEVKDYLVYSSIGSFTERFASIDKV